MPQDDDDDLLLTARAGDPVALEALLVRHQPRVYRFSMKMCRDPEDAKDVLQDTLIAAARGLRGFEGTSSLTTWLFAIARSFCLKKRRRTKAAPRREQVVPATDRIVGRVRDPSATPEEWLAGQEVAAELEAAIAALDPPYREVLVLRDVEGLTALEVAQVLGLRVEAVKSRLHRARATVRRQLAPLLHAPPDPPGSSVPGCPDVAALFSRHLEGQISPDVCDRMEQHLRACARCRAACESFQRVLSLCRSAPAGDLPADAQEAVRTAIRTAIAQGS